MFNRLILDHHHGRFAQLLRQKMRREGWSQAYVAEVVGVGKSTLCNILRHNVRQRRLSAHYLLMFFRADMLDPVDFAFVGQALSREGIFWSYVLRVQYLKENATPKLWDPKEAKVCT